MSAAATTAATITTETDGTRAVRDTARGSKNRTLTGRIEGLFRAALKAVTQRAEAPAPPKKSRKRRDEDKGRATWRKPLERRFLDAIHAGAKARARAAYRKHIKRLLRKVRGHIGDDARDSRPTVDSDWWHWHRQSMADPGSSSASHDHNRSLHQRGPNYHSPTL